MLHTHPDGPASDLKLKDSVHVCTCACMEGQQRATAGRGATHHLRVCLWLAGFEGIVDFCFKGGNKGFPLRAPPAIERSGFVMCFTNPIQVSARTSMHVHER